MFDHTGGVPGYPSRGAPRLISLATAQTAAGADFSLTPPVGVRWKLLGGSAKLATSSAVATRQVYLSVTHGGVEVFRMPAQSTQAASLTYTYQLLPGIPPQTLVSTFPNLPCPVGLILDERWRLASVTTLIDTADQWGPVELLVEELGPTP